MNKRRIITSALIGTIALVGLSVSLTLAWYGASDRLSMRSLDVEVAGQANLKVSTKTDPDSFVSNLDLSPEDKNFVFSPVSSMNKSGWMNNKSKTPLFYDCSSPLVPTNGVPFAEPTTVGVFSQKLYLLTDIDYYVTLDVDPESANRSTFEPDTFKNHASADDLVSKNPGWNKEISEIEDKLNSLVNCLRISILVTNENYYNYYIIDPTKDTTRTDCGVTVFGGRLDNDNDGYYDTYFNQNNESFEVVYGEIVNNDRDNIVYKNPEQSSGEPQSSENPSASSSTPKHQFFTNSFNGVSKNNVHTFDEEASIRKAAEKNSELFAKEESLSLSEINSAANKLLIPCFAYEPTEIVLSIYLEGWDRDCINSTMGAHFDTKLSFKLLRGITK